MAVPASANPYAGKLLTTPLQNTMFSQLSPATQGYINKKLGYDLGNQERLYGTDSAMWNINHLLNAKGGQQVNDWSQVDAAMGPLIAKRNKRGLGGFLGMAIPIGLSLLAPGIGTALGGALGIGTTAGTALAGAGLGGLSGVLTGQNPITSALMGGLSGGFQGANAGTVLAKSGPLAGKLVTPGYSSVTALSGPLSGSMVSPSFGSSIGTSIAGYNPSTLDNLLSGAARLKASVGNIGNSLSRGLGLGDVINAGGTATSGGGSMFGNSAGGGFSLGSALGSALDYYNASKQADELENAQRAAMATLNPFRSSGVAANNQLAAALAAGFNPSDLENDPGYQFRLREGNKALEQSFAARGMGQSGAALKAAQEYGQGFANSEYADAHNRWLAQNQQLAGQAGMGLNAANNYAALQQNLGNIGASATDYRSRLLSEALRKIFG